MHSTQENSCPFYIFIDVGLHCLPDPEANATPNQSAPAAILPPVESSTQVATAVATAGELPDLSANLTKTGCDNGPGGAGAASYFVGEIRLNGSNATGEENGSCMQTPNGKPRADRTVRSDGV